MLALRNVTFGQGEIMPREADKPVPADPARTAAGLVEELRALGSETDREGMGRFGINVDSALGVSVYKTREVARKHRNDHELAAALWATDVHEARMLAVFVDDPAQVTPEQMDAWAADFDSWDITDQATTSLFDLTPHAWGKAYEWSAAPEEFVKRGAFALMAGLAVHDKKAPDADFVAYLPVIERESGDGRNFVKKAVDWALRNIGKRDAALNGEAVACAERILAAAGDGRDPEARSMRWIAKDTLRELNGDKIRKRLGLPPLDPAHDGDVTP